MLRAGAGRAARRARPAREHVRGLAPVGVEAGPALGAALSVGAGLAVRVAARALLLDLVQRDRLGEVAVQALDAALAVLAVGAVDVALLAPLAERRVVVRDVEERPALGA